MIAILDAYSKQEPYYSPQFELLTVAEAAKILKISRRQLYYLIQRNEISHIKITPTITRFSRQNLEEYIARKQVNC